MGVKAALGGLPWKLIGIGLAALAVAAFVLMAFHWKHQAADRKEKLEIICKATRDASDNPKLGCGNVPIQIGELGASVKNLKAAIASQNAAVNDLAAKSRQAQDEAAQASRNAKKRAQGAEDTARRLIASSRSGEHLAKPCAPSKAVSDAWR